MDGKGVDRPCVCSRLLVDTGSLLPTSADKNPTGLSTM